MRIITGSAKGTKLLAPRGLKTRPTADRIKESVFNILGNVVIESSVLDLFAGTGNLGLEALSRGAEHAIFIDQCQNSVTVIRQNAINTKLIEQVEIYKNDVLKALDKLAKSGRLCDLIFCDPPYNRGFVANVLKKIDDTEILKPNGIIVLEHSQHEPIVLDFKNIQVKRTEKYGETLISFLIHHDI